MSFAEHPAQQITLEQVLDVILRTEQRHRVVWTAGRVLKEEGSLYQVATGNPAVRKLIHRRVRRILKMLVRHGVLAERGLQFNFGTTTEVSYDLVDDPQQTDQGFNSLNEPSHNDINRPDKSVETIG